METRDDTISDVKVTRPNRSLPLLLLMGLALIGAAYGVRGYVASRRRPTPPPLAARTPEVDKMEAELAGLVAAVQKSPKDPEVRWKLARFFVKNELYDRAEREMQTLLTMQPRSERVYLALGKLFLVQNKHSEAEDVYRAAARLFPKDAEAKQGLTASLYHQGRYLEAMRAGKEAVKANPTDPNTHLMYGMSALDYALQYPNPATHADELALAQYELERVSKIWPDNPQILMRLSTACGATRDRKAAIKYAQRALKLAPDQESAYIVLTVAYSDNGQQADAGRTAAEGLVKFPDSGTLNDLYGRAVQTSGDPAAFEKSVAAFRKAVAAMPERANLHERLGVACLRTGKYAEARQAFENAARLNPHRPFPFQQLVSVYTRLGDKAKAQEAARIAQGVIANDQQLSKFQSLSMQNPDDINLHFILGDRYVEMDRIGPARDEYLAVLRLDPNNKRAKDALNALVQRVAAAQSAPAAAPPK